MDLFGIDFSPIKQTGLSLAIDGQAVPSRSGADAAASPLPSPDIITKTSAPTAAGGHFVHAGSNRSVYISGLLKGLELEKNFANQMRSVVAGYNNLVELTAKAKALAGDKINNIDRERIGKEAADHVKTVIDDEVSDTNNEKLEEIREEIEQKADETVKPESEKALENEPSPQKELEESLDDNEQAAAGAEEAASPLAEEAQAPDAEPEIVAETGPPTPTGPVETGLAAPVRSPIDLMV
jgi:hypothetical protein